MLIEILRVSWKSIRANKMRSFLTMLGIIIGVLAVVLSSAIGLASKDSVTSRVEGLGSNVLTVSPGSSSSGGISRGFGTASTLTMQNADEITAQDPDVSAAAPVMTTSEQVVAGSENTNTSIVGTTPDYATIKNLSMAEGQFLSQQNVSSGQNVAVLGSDAATTLFTSPGSVVGQSIEINGIPFTVIGVAASQGSSGFSNVDDDIYIPDTTESSLLTGTDTVNQIVVSAKSATGMDNAQLEVESTLRVAHQLTGSTADDFTISNQATILSTLSSVSQVLSIELDGISALSLLVGGIGIMNIMLVSVTERTREIGIRKAIGARKSIISAQFLLESVSLSLTGSLIGLGLGFVGALIAEKVMDVGSLFSIQTGAIAVLFCLLIGVIFGVHPARKAANLKPIDALRFE